jgi:hypothetical protein
MRRNDPIKNSRWQLKDGIIKSTDETPSGDLWSLTTVKLEGEEEVLRALTLIGGDRRMRFPREIYGPP